MNTAADPTFTDEPADETPDAVAATPQETRQTYLARSKAGYAKVRHTFIQAPPGASGGSTPGTLSQFGRNHRAAVLYLALLTNWPWLVRETIPRASGAWIRFLSSDLPGALTWTEQSLSHAWKTLEGMGLIARPRQGRLLNVQPRREDGKADYVTPTGKNSDLYFVVPDQFWLDELHATLSWPALAVLLVLLKETGGRESAELRVDRADQYYGISRTTVESGLTELRKRHLLSSRDRFVKDVDTGDGRRRASIHTLLGPFSMQARQELQGAAKARVDGKAAVTFAGGDEDEPPEAASA
jgi:hypothetical protein